MKRLSVILHKRKDVKVMASIFDVAAYILERCGAMSAMKLQKLCYYAQAWSLVWDDEPLFSEDFEAWANGPVCRVLFNRTKGQFKVTATDEDGNSNSLNENQKDTINRVLEHYASHDAQWLSQLSHLEAPYKEARKGLPAGIGSDRMITKESMALYYGGI